MLVVFINCCFGSFYVVLLVPGKWFIRKTLIYTSQIIGWEDCLWNEL